MKSQEVAQKARLQKIIKNKGGKAIPRGDIIGIYEQLHGEKPTYEGKFKSYIEGISGVKVTNKYVKWVGGSSNSKTTPPQKFDCKVCGIFCPNEKTYQLHIEGKKHKKKVTSTTNPLVDKNHNEKETTTIISSTTNSTTKMDDSEKKQKVKDKVKIAVHDSSADIITFKESVGGKSAQQEESSKGDVFGFSAGFESMSLDEKEATIDEMATTLFLSKIVTDGIQKNKGLSLFSSSSIEQYSEGALFGHLFPSDASSKQVGEGVYLATHEPFCFVTIGVQGAGKSHTSSCVLESCLVPFQPGNIVKLNAPMTTMVLHYDQNTSSICEAAGLLSPCPSIKAKMNRFGHDVGAVPKEKAVILVSPAFYKQRKKFYGDTCTVRPLLFQWRSLTADHIKRIMRIESGDNQLYVASFLDLLRGYQKQGTYCSSSICGMSIVNIKPLIHHSLSCCKTKSCGS